MQQVNLYTDAFRPKKVLLPLNQIVGLSIALIVLLVFVSVGQQFALSSDREALAELQEKAELMSERVAKMEEEVSLRVLDESLVAANDRLKEKIEARRNMINVLDSLVLDDQKGGFSELMVGLARQTSNALWLTNINVGFAGSTLSLKGTTLDADEVPAYLQRLREEPTFVGRNFTLFQLDADEKKRRRLHFELNSQLSGNAADQADGEASKRVLPIMTIGGVQ